MENQRMENERVEYELLEQCGQVATLVECFAWLQRCSQWLVDECIERLEELYRAKRSRRWTQTIRGGEDRATRGCKVAIRATFRAH